MFEWVSKCLKIAVFTQKAVWGMKEGNGLCWETGIERGNKKKKVQQGTEKSIN